jgi:hypothetical protein
MLTRSRLRSFILVHLILFTLVVSSPGITPANREYFFTAETGFTVLSGPWDIASADLDNDGHMDLVTANRYSSSVSVALNDGTGGFGSAWTYAVGYKPWELDLADLDGDGDEDIAVTLTDIEVAGPPKDDYDLVAVLFNDGSGGFSGLERYPIGNEPRTVFLADLGEDGNGDVDIITANEQNSSSISVLFNDGSGAFSNATNYSLGLTPRSLFVADLNGDGFNDTVTANKIHDNVTVLFNNGTGFFENTTSVSVGWGPWDVFVENITGNPANDIVVLNKHHGTVDIQENDGTGNFVLRAQYDIGDNNSVYLAVGDADLDGHLDIMCSSVGHDLLTVLFYNTTTSSYQRIQRTVAGGPRSFVLADLGVGKPGFMNIATANVGQNSVSILVSDVPPTISIIEPDGIDDTVEFEFRIEWEDYDPDSNAVVTLYYYRAGPTPSETSLGSFFEDDPADFLTWNVSSLDEGNYYIKIVISDDFSSVTVSSNGSITVDFPAPGKPPGDTSASPGLIVVAIVGAVLLVIVLYLILRKKPKPTETSAPVQQEQTEQMTPSPDAVPSRP